MGNRIVNLGALVIIGGIVANLVAPSNVPGTKAVIDGFTKLWSTSTATVLGKTA